jgi:hypothetical protein
MSKPKVVNVSQFKVIIFDRDNLFIAQSKIIYNEKMKRALR